MPSPPEQSARPSLRDEQRDVTRRRLVGAAKTVFERTGYGQTTIGDIASEASINRATFYLHFTNKSEVLAAVANDVILQTAKYWQLLDEALVRDSRTAIREWLATAFEWWDQHAGIRPALEEASAADPVIAARWGSTLDTLSLELERYLGRLPADERDAARHRVQFMVVQLDQLCFRWRVQRVVDIDQGYLLDLLTEMWCSVLRIDAP